MFSLRSIERYGFGFDGVLLVGAVPSFVKGVESVVCDDNSSRFVLREGNIRGKLARGLAIADSIIAWNDDYYLVKPTDLGNIPYYFRENDMQETIDRKKGGWKTMQNTREYLLNKGFDVKMYDLHCPIIYKKAEFERVNEADWTKDYGYGIKSLYSNSNNVEGKWLPDSKIMEGLPERIVFNTIQSNFLVSSSTRINKHLLKFLEKEFPHKSKWEK
jgi:hypothetical protein